jgi:hypothetical protein
MIMSKIRSMSFLADWLGILITLLILFVCFRNDHEQDQEHEFFALTLPNGNPPNPTIFLGDAARRSREP